MSNKPKRKGDQFERDCVKVLRGAGIKAQRTRAGWTYDQGDIETPDLPIAWQCKNYRNIAAALRDGVDGSQVQAANAEKQYGVAVVKRRLKPASDAYVVMSLEQFSEIAKQLRGID